MNSLLGLLILIATAPVFGQGGTPVKAPTAAAAKPAAPIKLDRSKVTNRIKLQFDEDLVKGNAENTELNFIQTRRENNFKKMIKIRENFIPEIESSASELGSK